MDEEQIEKIEQIVEILKTIKVGQGKFILDMSQAIETLKKPLPLPEATVSAMMILVGRHVDVHMIDGSLYSGIFSVPPVQPELGIQLLQDTMEKNIADSRYISLDSILKIVSKGVQVLVENGEWNTVNLEEPQRSAHSEVQKTDEEELQPQKSKLFEMFKNEKEELQPQSSTDSEEESQIPAHSEMEEKEKQSPPPSSSRVHSNASSSSLGYVGQGEPSLHHSGQRQQSTLQYIAPWNLQYREPCQTSFLYSSQRPRFLGNQRPSLQHIPPWHLQYREPWMTSFLNSSQRPHFLGYQQPSLQYIAPRQTSFASSSQRIPFLGYQLPSLQYIAPRQRSFASSSQRPSFLGYQQQNIDPGSSHHAAGFGNLNDDHGGHVEPGMNTIEEEFQIDTEKIARGEDTRTSLMIKNIPAWYTSGMLMAEISKNSQQGTYDFFYLPIRINKTHKNVGYAFINMVSPSDIIRFYQDFNGTKWENSEKVASLSYAKFQGMHALVEAHQQSPHSITMDMQFRPTLFLSDEQYQERTQYSYLNIQTREPKQGDMVESSKARSDEKQEEN